MKKESTLRVLLGITQQDMSELLGVTRSHYSMFESGKRSLPLSAKQTLAALLTHITAADKAKPAVSVARQETSKQMQLKKLQRENERQQLLVARKIATLTKKHNAQVKTLQLVEFLNDRPENGTIEKELLHSIARKTTKAVEEKTFAQLVDQQIKHELLVLQQTMIETDIEKLAVKNGIL